MCCKNRIIRGVLPIFAVGLCLLLFGVSCTEKSPREKAQATVESRFTEKSEAKATAYQLAPLVREVLKAVDNEQKVAIEAKVAVVIPPKGLQKEQKLTISEVVNPPPVSANTRRIGVYSIKFDDPLDIPDGFVLEFNCDLSGREKEISDGNFFEVEFFDESTKMWLPVPADYDEAGKVLRADVTRNGLWQVVMVQSFFGNHRVLVTDNFVIFFNLNEFYPEDFNRLHQLKARQKRILELNRLNTELEKARRDDPSRIPSLKKAVQNLKEAIAKEPFTDGDRNEITQLEKKLADMPTSFHNLPEDIYNRYDAPRYIVELAYHGENAWEKYKKAFGKEPYQKNLNVTTKYHHSKALVKTRKDISTWESYSGATYGVEVSDKFPIYVQSKIQDPKYYARSGSIYIGIMPAMHDYYISHELFHAVQNKDYWMGMKQSGFGKISDWVRFTRNNNWWLESTAEYAARKTVLNKQYPTLYKLNAAYFPEDFFSSSIDHSYKNAWFWNYLVENRRISFADMYKTVAEASTTQGLQTVLEKTLKSKSGSTLTHLYRDFVGHALFDGTNPFQGKLPVEPLPLDRKQRIVKFSLPQGLVAQVQGLLPEDPGRGRSFEVNFHTTYNTSYHQMGRMKPWWVDVYLLKQNDRKNKVEYVGGWSLELFLSNPANKTFEKTYPVHMGPGDGLYAVATGHLDSGSTFTVHVKEIDEDKASGYWKLVKVENAGVKATDRGREGGKYIKTVTRSGHIEARGRIMKGRDRDQLEALTLSLKWAPPPAAATPGDQWDGRYKAEVLEDIHQDTSTGEIRGKNTGYYSVKCEFGAARTEKPLIPDRLPILHPAVHMIRGEMDPRLQEGSVYTFYDRSSDYKYLCLYVRGGLSTPMGTAFDAYFYFYEWTPGKPPAGNAGKTTDPAATPAASPASSPQDRGDDYLKRLSAAKTRYEAAYSRYTTLTTTGGPGNVQEALDEYREAHRALKELEAERGGAGKK